MSANHVAPVALPTRTPNGRARAVALQAHRPEDSGVGTVSFRSRGHLLIIGHPAEAASCARALLPALHCILLVPPGSRRAVEIPPDALLVEGRVSHLAGHLGGFEVRIDTAGGTLNPGGWFAPGGGAVDLILDLGESPVLDREMPPLGYYAPRGPQALEQALHELRELVGEFEKPRYFAYDAALCAHGRSGLAGCRRCLDACPTLAIRSLGETIEVDPYLCQGGGGCATACPSGAIRYAYPAVSTLLTSIREALGRYRSAGGEDPQVLFFASTNGEDVLEQRLSRLPESVLPFQVEELGSVGLDTWLATLAYGARRVVLFTTQAIPRAVLREISLQISYARAILGGMGYRPDCLKLVLSGERDGTLVETLGDDLPVPAILPGGFMPFDEKRTTLGLAIDYLYAQAPAPRPLADLPDDAPFGAIEIDPRSCTLCMACVAVCPARALYAGNDRPALQFIEFNCVQCGLCHTACPEDAVRLLPRMMYEQAQSHALRTLHEEAPFNCIRCGRPFATAAVIQRMTERLAEHWMFRDEQARRRIGMCQDCRVLDVFEQQENADGFDQSAADA